MTAKVKAKELIYNYFNFIDYLHYEEAKQCALIAVDELIKSYSSKKSILPRENEYWKEVKTEIEKL